MTPQVRTCLSGASDRYSPVPSAILGIRVIEATPGVPGRPLITVRRDSSCFSKHPR